MPRIELQGRASHRVNSAVALLTLSLTLAQTAAADSDYSFVSGDEQATLVELFTSQGCSSCPPAERWLGHLKDDPRLWKEIIPVAFHVDYWDYIGWRDIYASPEYSARQRRYRTANRIDSVYTPGFVVNGREWRGWFRGGALPLARNRSGELRVAVDDGQLHATYTSAGHADQVSTLHVALLGVGLQVEVERGENAGRRLGQDFTVLWLIELSSSDREWTTTLPEIAMPGDARRAIAAWVSADGDQRPLQAVGGWIADEP